MNRLFLFAIFLTAAFELSWCQSADEMDRNFHVRYVAGSTVYIDAGKRSGIIEGMRLVITPAPSPTSEAAQQQAAPAATAELKVVAVAENSTVCEVVSSTRELVVGDVVTLNEEDAATIVTKRTLSKTRFYPAVVTFTDGDPLDEDVREETPRPPSPEVNRARGRIGLEYSGVFRNGQSGGGSSQLGMVFRGDVMRIEGTYWNLSGYWRGILRSQGAGTQTTLQDLMSRTYHLSITYDNPNSKWVAGGGRMFVPWASSLETIDGAYGGRKIGQKTVVGAFAGTTPDPTSWTYDVNRRIAGGFVSFTQGSFGSVHAMTTLGAGVEMQKWSIDRPFVFAENTITYRQIFSIFDAVQVDRPSTTANMPVVGTGMKQAFISSRLQASQRLVFDFNYNYFRDVPKFDPQLVGTTLLDKYLFQGFSGGVRVEGPKRLTFYTDIGQSNSSRDKSGSWNTMFGVSMARIWKTGINLDARYSRFNSFFAQGSYRSLSASRNIGNILQFQAMIGTQSFHSSLMNDSGSHFINSTLEWNFGSRYFLDNGFTLQRGGLQNYNQMYVTFGYRFDNRGRKRPELRP